jgi:16S rRNA (uracil1498-N3)-methyltransferase
VSLAPHVQVLAPLAAGMTQVALSDTTLHHLRRVLRLGDGAVLSLTDGAGGSATATLQDAGAVVTSEVQREERQRPELVLVQALAKGRRLDDAVRAACEIGVARIVPIVAQRTQGRPGAEERVAIRARWQGIAASALGQSRGSWLVHIDEVVTIEELAERSDPVGLRAIAVPGARSLPETIAQAGEEALERVSIAIGPEGGWAAEEVALLVAAAWTPVGLGHSVIRTEHAGLVALAAVAATTGRWRSGG